MPPDRDAAYDRGTLGTSSVRFRDAAKSTRRRIGRSRHRRGSAHTFTGWGGPAAVLRAFAALAETKRLHGAYRRDFGSRGPPAEPGARSPQRRSAGAAQGGQRPAQAGPQAGRARIQLRFPPPIVVAAGHRSPCKRAQAVASRQTPRFRGVVPGVPPRGVPAGGAYARDTAPEGGCTGHIQRTRAEHGR